MRKTYASIRLTPDTGGYIRRECPGCHRSFKTRPMPEDSTALHGRVGLEFRHENGDELSALTPLRSCPYCGIKAAGDSWHTAEQRAYLEKVAERFGEHVRFEQLSGVQKGKGARPTFVAIAPDPMPEEPLPDFDHFRRIHLVCCSEDVKLDEGYRFAVHCYRCGAEHQIGTRRALHLDLPGAEA